MSRDTIVPSLVDSCDYLRQRFVDRIDPRRIDVVIELGCRDGWDSLKLRAAFDAEVHAFECNPAGLALCRPVLQQQDKITLVERAAWNAEGEIDFYPVYAATQDGRRFANIGASSCFQAVPGYVQGYEQSHIRVPATRLDVYCRDAGITRVDMICLDIQGAALHALEGAGALLHGVQYVIAELEEREIYAGQDLLEPVCRYLAEHGLHLAERIRRDDWSSDCLFTRDVPAQEAPISPPAAADDGPILFQILDSRIAIDTDAREIRDRLSYVVQRASQDIPPARREEVSIVRGEAGYDIRANGAALFTEVNADQVVERTFLYLHRAALSTFPDHIRLHAASGVHGGRAFLLVGDAHSGKTTLALRLLFAGLEMLGDEMVLLRDGIATTFPRRFYARASSQDLLPEFGLLDGMLPFVSNSQEARLVGVDPTTFGRPWHIAPAPVAAIFFLDPNFGARSGLVRCTKTEMVRRILPQCTAPASGRAGWIGDLCGIVDRAETWILRNGEPDSAILAIRKALC